MEQTENKQQYNRYTSNHNNHIKSKGAKHPYLRSEDCHFGQKNSTTYHSQEIYFSKLTISGMRKVTSLEI